MASPVDNGSTRPMRLKVLYTFDAESKNNCLARWPNVLDVQTAFIDDLTQIGVVDLKTCLQALTSSSPELLAQHAIDYTIYAFDYSEEGIPLSGQGLLSTVFDSNVQNNLTDTTSKVVTGRVTKNVLGLFSGNGQETLEVKLRLLPVTKQVHSNSVFGQPGHHDFGGTNQQFGESEEWSNLLSNEDGSIFTQQSTGLGSPVDRSGIEHMQRMLHEGSVPRENPTNRSSESLQISSNSRQGSRPGTPGQAQPFNAPARPSLSQASRPSSRASFRAAAQPIHHKRRESFNSGYYSGDEVQLEEGPIRKRAKVTQVGAPSRSDLNIERQPESLRMAASTASSVRGHRPIAVNPAPGALQGNNFAEESVRPPTPIPGTHPLGHRKQPNQGSSLRRGSQQHVQADVSYQGPSTTNTNDAAATSPEFTMGPSVSSTPANIPSSPPVITNYGSLPTSPVLLRPHPPAEQQDLNFMDEIGDMIDGNKNFPWDDGLTDMGANEFQLQPTIEVNAATEMHNNFTPVSDGGGYLDDELTNSLLPPPPKPSDQPASSKRPLSRAQTTRPAIRSGMSSPKLAPAPYPRARQLEEEMAAQPSLPPIAASDPVGRQLQRSNTWAGDMSDVPMSDAPVGEGGRAKSGSKKKVGREQTKARLENALAQNEMPPYCDNCGTIDTPAWRRVFARTLPGHLYESFELWPETQGAYVWKQIAEKAADGTVIKFRAYKLSKSPEDKGAEWTNVTLCNPCGLWFHKNKCMRPPEKWTRNPKDPNQKKKRAYRPKSKRVAAKKGQEDDSKSDAPDQGSEGSSPADGATEAEMENDDDRQRPDTGVMEPELPPIHQRATSAEPMMTDWNAASVNRLPAGCETRAFRSSPVRNECSHGQAVENDLTPKPLRRQLFPSPIHKTPSKTQSAPSGNDTIPQPLSEVPNFCRRSPRLNKSADVLGNHPKTPEKENRVPKPAHDDDDDLNDLFNDGEDGFLLPPQTPTPARRSDRLLLKTPNKTPSGINPRTTGAHPSPNVHRASQEVKTPKKDFIMGSNRTVEEMTPFTRMIHFELIREHATKNKSTNETSTKVPENPPAQHSDLDFPDLPDLEGVSLSSRPFGSMHDLDLSTFNTNFPDIFQTDVPGSGSSPPNSYYNYLNSDFLDPALTNGQWDGDGDMDVQSGSNGALLAAPGTTGLRRSPRKNKSG